MPLFNQRARFHAHAIQDKRKIGMGYEPWHDDNGRKATTAGCFTSIRTKFRCRVEPFDPRIVLAG